MGSCANKSKMSCSLNTVAVTWMYCLLLVCLLVSYAGCEWITLTEQRGLVQSPNYPQLYPPNNCSRWSIKREGQPNDVITMSFEDLNIPYSKDCASGYVQIGPLPVAKLCGNLNTSSPAVYISERDHAWIKFCSVGWDPGRGFSLRYMIAANTTKNNCQPDEFQCSYGKCILNRWKCNGAAECEDASDEQDCASYKQLTTPKTLACGESNFGCFDRETSSFRCFLKNKLCDNHVDCEDGFDERKCSEKNCTYHLEGPNGFFHSPNYPNNYKNNAHCTWTIHVKYGSIVQLRFMEFAIQNKRYSDSLKIYDGGTAAHPLLGVFYGGHKPSRVLNATGNRMFLEFSSDGSVTELGFNVSFQIKGECMSHQLPCQYGEKDCYDKSQQCDGVWDCPLHGGDERGCGNCKEDLFQCGKFSSQCYSELERCNGQFHCTEHKADEANCTPEQCGPHMGTFLCNNRLCIYESWLCDGQDDCQDFSDEMHCSRPSVKVITAAVIGSLICGLLLVIALGCTCKLYAMRMQEHSFSHVPVSPSVHEQSAMWARFFAPPSYPEAMVTSRNYEEVRQEIIRRERRSRRGGRRSRRHRSRQGASVASQSNAGDDVALLDLQGDEEDMRFLDLGSNPEQADANDDFDDDDDDDSECDMEDCNHGDSSVEIDIAHGVQWHRQIPKHVTSVSVPLSGTFDAPLSSLHTAPEVLDLVHIPLVSVSGVSVQTEPSLQNISAGNIGTENYSGTGNGQAENVNVENNMENISLGSITGVNSSRGNVSPEPNTEHISMDTMGPHCVNISMDNSGEVSENINPSNNPTGDVNTTPNITNTAVPPSDQFLRHSLHVAGANTEDNSITTPSAADLASKSVASDSVASDLCANMAASADNVNDNDNPAPDISVDVSELSEPEFSEVELATPQTLAQVVAAQTHFTGTEADVELSDNHNFNDDVPLLVPSDTES